MFLYVLNIIIFSIFGLSVMIVFFLFIWGSSYFLFAGKEEQGREMVFKSLYWLFIILIMFLTFSAITYFVKRGDVFNLKETTGEFPLSPASEFPPAPIYK